MDETRRFSLPWSAIIAGALTASALIFVFTAFAGSLGLAMASPSPTWRDASIGLALLTGLYLILAAVISFGTGGYVSGRLAWGDQSSRADRDFRDGVSGLIMWALALTLSSFLTAAVTSPISRAVSPAQMQSGSAGEPLIAFEIDRLLRTDRPVDEDVLTQARGQATRFAYAAAGRIGVTPDDRAMLTRTVGIQTGAAAEAERRVNEFTERATTAIHRARRMGVLMGFMTAAAVLAGAAAAWFTAQQGARGLQGGWSMRRGFRRPREAFASMSRRGSQESVGTHHPLIASDRVEGTTVYGRNRERLGSISHLMIDKLTGRVAYAVMNSGSLLGMGREDHHLPWSLLTYDTSLGGYHTNIAEDDLRRAPPFSSEQEGLSRENEQALHDHWSATYYWQSSERSNDGDQQTR